MKTADKPGNASKLGSIQHVVTAASGTLEEI